MSREKQLQASCQSVHNEYKQCLSGSNRDARKCTSFISQLRACEKRNPDATACAKEFVLMRECNRPGGPQLLLTTDAQGEPRYEVQPHLVKQFATISPDVGPAEAPARSSALMQQTIDQLKHQTHAKAFDFIPYSWESLRTSPGK